MRTSDAQEQVSSPGRSPCASPDAPAGRARAARNASAVTEDRHERPRFRQLADQGSRIPGVNLCTHHAKGYPVTHQGKSTLQAGQV
jgi:hypothetical protein